MGTNVYVMNPMIEARAYPEGCYCTKCNKRLNVGDKVITKVLGNGNKPYCSKCAKVLNII